MWISRRSRSLGCDASRERRASVLPLTPFSPVARRARAQGRDARGREMSAYDDVELTSRSGGGDPTIVRQYEDQMYMDLEPMRELVNTGEDGLSDAEAERRMRMFGKNELEEKVDHPLLKLAKGFIGPMPMMIW